MPSRSEECSSPVIVSTFGMPMTRASGRSGLPDGPNTRSFDPTVRQSSKRVTRYSLVPSKKATGASSRKRA